MTRLNAFSLVEVALALGVAAFVLLGIAGLLPVGINHNLASVRQTEAANVATAIVADMLQVPSATAIRANPSLTSKSQRYGIDVASSSTTVYLDENGSLQTSSANSRYKTAIFLTQPQAGERTATHGSITISWPAEAVSPLGGMTLFVALDRN